MFGKGTLEGTLTREEVSDGISHGISLPARLDDAGNVSLERQVAEADAAQAELAHEGARASADRAARPIADRLLVPAGDGLGELPRARNHLGETGHD